MNDQKHQVRLLVLGVFTVDDYSKVIQENKKISIHGVKHCVETD